MAKRIMIIGGGKWQVPIIQKAKAMGHYVICTNLYVDSVGFKYADESHVVDVLDKEKNLLIAKNAHIDAVLTDQSDIAVNTVAYIAEQLHLKGVGSNIAELYTNKLRMRQELIIQDLHHPRYLACRSLEEAEVFFQKIKRPIIIKPLANQSSRGVFKVSSINELQTKYPITAQYSIRNMVLLEEYIDGIELTVEGFKTDKEHISLAVSKKKHYEDLPSVAKELVYLNDYDDFNIETLFKINNHLFNQVPFGITHTEYKYHNGKFYLIEAAIRGGGTKISSHIIPAVSGIDVNELLIKSILDENEISVNLSHEKRCAVLRFFDFKPGYISKIVGIDFLASHHNVIDFDFEFKEGSIISAPDDDRSRVGYYIAYALSKEKLTQIMKDIEERVYVEYQ